MSIHKRQKTGSQQSEKNTSTKDNQEEISHKKEDGGKISAYDNNERVVYPQDGLPIVVLWGPSSSGKTNILRCLGRYLREQGNKVSANKQFRHSNGGYKETCDEFDQLIKSNKEIGGTPLDSFLLVDVYDERNESRVICHILESSGEALHEAGRDKYDNMPLYMRQIIDLKCKIIWIIILEIDFQRGGGGKYEEQINQFMAEIESIVELSKDKPHATIFVCNKVDTHRDDTPTNAPVDYKVQGNVDRLKENLELIYRSADGKKSVFNFWPETNPIKKWLHGPYRWSFVPFSSGTPNSKNPKIITPNSDDYYPQTLWDKIKKEL